ncbi:MAG TPA: CRTAC1 family protein [Vicinamibacterales bacterium]|nr:CRTAC1 family protein [Vicinamibacterales bacterium]
MIRLLAALTLAAATSVLSAADAQLPQFVDATREAGLAFQHVNGASADKHLAETMGSGGLFFDYDGDGWVDVFLVDGGSLADPAVAKRARHRLYHNRGNGTFDDVTARSGIRHSAYGMGACAADYDGDGDVDLYITNDGSNVLYQNRGDGRFVDVTAATGVGEARWSASCAFADLDGDGDLDLWVTNYVAADRGRSPFCGDARRGVRFYCHPLNYDPLPNTLYRNDGGTFTDVSTESGVAALRSNGLGVIIVDSNNDGRPDVFVANDSLPNYLFRNDGKLRFREEALTAGVAMAADGQPRAGMGIDAGDYDRDGRLDLVITNLDFQMHSLYHGLDGGLFAWSTIESGIGYTTLPFVGFGVAFLDTDNDGRLELTIANGHILDNAPDFRSGATYRQRKLLFRNTTGRRFAEVGRSAGPGFALEKVGRGLATGDIDNDGDLDLLVTNNGQTADLLRNDGASRVNALLVRLVGTGMNRDAIGARVRVTTGAITQRRDVLAGSSYLSQNDLRLHFGLGAAKEVDALEVRWPSGRTETLRSVPAGQILTIEEGKGIVSRTGFAR